MGRHLDIRDTADVLFFEKDTLEVISLFEIRRRYEESKIKRLTYLHDRTKNSRIKKKLTKRIIKEVWG